jgi:crotonobetainyl-CoA:carnitine CoA-transferase CaiB-like acyl-CoA transferase
MLTSAAYVVSNDLVMVDGDSHARVADREQLGVSAVYRLYPCAEGWVFLALASDDEWRRFVESIADPLLTDDARFASSQTRERHDEALAAEIGRVMLTERAEHWEKHLAPADIACVVVDFSGFEAWLERHDVLLAASHPVFGDYYRLPFKWNFEHRPSTDVRACAVGEHSRSILGELGRTPTEIDRLIENGAVLQWIDER